MDWKEALKRTFSLYAVTDLQSETDENLQNIKQACRGGADVVQLRTKVLSDAAFIRLGMKVRKVASHYKKLLVVNDRVDLALGIGADGVHLGQEDMPIAMARKLAISAGVRLWIGKSTHSIAQARAAVREGADVLGVGPVFATPTKPMAQAVGLNLVRELAKSIRIPWVAIGGINLKNLSLLLEAGATRVAVVRAIFDVPDSCLAASQFKKLIEGAGDFSRPTHPEISPAV